MNAYSAATVIMVVNLDRSLAFYKDVLGFAEDFRFGNYAGLKLGEVLVHLSQFGNPNSKPPGFGAMYIFCDEVDDYYGEITAKGAKAPNPPKDYEYGMRDFVVEDPDGNCITFAAEAKKK